VGSAQRKITGGFYAHGGFTVAYLATEQPYDIPGVGAAMRRAQAVPAETYGRVQLKLHENEKHPLTQCFVVKPTGRRLSRRQFEELVKTVFPGYELESNWVTNPRDPNLVIALLIELIFGD
jgi:hypothetical protein